jgi:sugar O-acyltransferase (sialic acid O-acetyltransferase NeuD family)
MNEAPNPFSQATPNFRILYIFGAGGSGREIVWLAEQAWGSSVRSVFLVDRSEYLRNSVNGIPVRLLSEAECLPDARYLVALGNPAQRRRAARACSDAGHQPTILVHPRAEMSRWVDLGIGTVVCSGTIITSNISIKAHVQINVSCTISHDVSIGEYSTLSPGVHVSGNVQIGHDVFIGTGASIINGKPGAPLVIGDGAVIAAGACVTKSVETGALVAGVPAVRKH